MVSVTRKLVQLISALTMNAHLAGFVTGRIYRGRVKRVCVPGLNCYSCPAAVGACPLGALQLAVASGDVMALAYTAGFLILFGVALGRAVCGFVCPFGLIQELLNAPFKRTRRPRLKPTLYTRYTALAFFVVALPLAGYLASGLGDPAFCKYICPAGTLQAGVPLVLLNTQLRAGIGVLFGWKMFLLICVVLACAVIYRPFCRICPLGAIYGLFNRVAFVRMRVDRGKCVGCGGCARVCPMATDCLSGDCVRCGRCVDGCGAGAIGFEKTWGSAPDPARAHVPLTRS